MTKHRKEILVGNTRTLDWLLKDYRPLPRHPMQRLVEDAIDNTLDDDELEVFYLRFGEKMSIRQVARELGYASHRVIQIKLEQIMEKVKKYINDNLPQD